MDSSKAQHDSAEDLVATDKPGRVNDAKASITPGTLVGMAGHSDDPAADVTCEALKIALSALQLYIAWHAGMVSAEVAMEDLAREIVKTTRRYTGSTQTGSIEMPGRSPSHLTGSTRAAPCGRIRARHVVPVTPWWANRKTPGEGRTK